MAAAGVMPTRNSWGLISVGQPMSIVMFSLNASLSLVARTIGEAEGNCFELIGVSG